MGSTGDGGLQLVLKCITGDESAGVHLEEQKDRRSSVGSLPGFLAGVACGLAELARSSLNITHEICFISSVYDHIKLTFVDAVR